MTSPDAAKRPARARTARERARVELTREIKEEARRQLAEAGAGGLSLRAVARELGMVSSALYRYYPSRDELLTALIIDAYNAIGAAAEQAAAAPPWAPAPTASPTAASPTAASPTAASPTAASPAAASPPAGPRLAARDRWTAACHAIRAWARAHPHEYALIYGSPVPGYRAPEATIGPAARVPLVFVGLLADAAAAGELVPPPGSAPLPDGPLAAQVASLTAVLGTPPLPAELLVGAVIAWTQLFGMISFELFGQFVGSFEPADALFARSVAELAALAGLR